VENQNRGQNVENSRLFFPVSREFDPRRPVLRDCVRHQARGGLTKHLGKAEDSIFRIDQSSVVRSSNGSTSSSCLMAVTETVILNGLCLWARGRGSQISEL